MGPREVEVQRIDRGHGTLTVTGRRVAEIDLPGFARRVLQPTSTMTPSDAWPAVNRPS